MSVKKKIQFCVEFVGVLIIIIFCVYLAIMAPIPDTDTSNGKPRINTTEEAKNKLSERSRETEGISVYYGDPSRVGELKKAAMYFMREQKWQDAETTLRVIIDSNQKHNDKRGLVSNYSLLGFVLRKQGKQQQELQAYRQELETARNLSPHDPYLECNAFIDMGGAQISMKQFKDAEKSLKTARKIAQNNSLDDLIPLINHNLRIVEQKILFGFGQPPEKRKGAVEPDIERARKAVKVLLRATGKDNVVLNTCALAIRQPDFSGVVAEEGCIVMFDDKGELVFGITTRIYDYKTGRKVQNRSLTRRELKNASSSLKSYYEGLDIPSYIRTIVVFSDSFKAAACEAILNMAEGREYFLEAEGKVAKIYRVENGERELIAAEMIYYRKQ